jgi:CDP-L-myo-inositol myo-inositolphosphotransferase
MYTVLLDGPDARLLGGSARARNARVAARWGASLCLLPDLAAYGPHAAMLVPPDVALMPSLFRDSTFDAATRRAVPTRLQAAGASVIVGSAATLATLSIEAAALTALPVEELDADTLLPIDTPRARRFATRVAILASEKPTDGWVSRHCNRPISRVCTRIALFCGLSANAASLVTLGVGLLCAWAAAQPSYLSFVATGLLFQLASVLDGVDGEIARATLTESEQGAQIDTLVDQLTYAACFVGMMVGWIRAGSGQVALASTVAIGVALAASLARGARFVARHGENASFVVIDRSVRRAALDTGHVPLRLAAGAFALLRRDVFAAIFLVVSLTGLRVLVPILILAGILIANLTFSLYGQELADAARAERRRPRAAAAT